MVQWHSRVSWALCIIMWPTITNKVTIVFGLSHSATHKTQTNQQWYLEWLSWDIKSNDT